MAEPSTATAASVSAAGITIFGVATGIEPTLLLAGMAGGWLALYQFDVVGLGQRIGFVILSALMGALLAPLGVSIALAMGLQAAPGTLMIPFAVVIGLLAIKVVGPRLISFVQKAKIPGEQT